MEPLRKRGCTPGVGSAEEIFGNHGGGALLWDTFGTPSRNHHNKCQSLTTKKSSKYRMLLIVGSCFE